MSDLDTFRNETRDWLEANCPSSMRWGSNTANATFADELTWGGKKETFPNPEAKLWLDRMASKGWTSPSWPKECGGAGPGRPADRGRRGVGEAQAGGGVTTAIL